MKLFFHRLAHWEYWPYELVYVPVYFVWVWYAMRARTLFFFNAANPSIKNGGFFMESKKAIYDLIPTHLYPKTILIAEGTAVDIVFEQIKSAGLQFPLIVKPDIGLRGASVSRVNNNEELSAYAQSARFDYLVQTVIPYGKEIGVFYVRHPDKPHGRITGIVAKEFVVVTGNGHLTIRELLQQKPRFALQINALQKSGTALDVVLADGETRNVVPFGNHSRGSRFTDATSHATPELVKLMDNICSPVHGFYFGRLDIMYDNWADLKRGRNFQIIEINGAGSEPTHIYDPSHSLWFAWKELIRHVRHMFEISVANHKKGYPYLSYSQGMSEYRKFRRHNRKIIP